MGVGDGILNFISFPNHIEFKQERINMIVLETAKVHTILFTQMRQ